VYTKADDASFNGPDAIKLTYTDRDGVKVEETFYSPWEAGVAANRAWVANLPENTTTTITANVIVGGFEGPGQTFEVKTKARNERFYYGVDDPGYNGRFWFATAIKYSVAWQWVPIMGKRLNISQTWDTWAARYSAFDSWYVTGKSNLYVRLPNCSDIEDDFQSLTIYGNVTDLRDIISFINLEELTFAKATNFFQTSNGGLAPATLDLRPLARLKKLKTINVKDGTPLTKNDFEKAGVTGVTINIL